MLEQSSLYFFQLLKGMNELQCHDLNLPALMAVRSLKELLLKQQAVFRLLSKAVHSGLEQPRIET